MADAFRVTIGTKEEMNKFKTVQSDGLMSRWGGQSCPQPAFSRLDPLESGSAAKIGCPTS
jgi:hypothetical protein